MLLKVSQNSKEIIRARVSKVKRVQIFESFQQNFSQKKEPIELIKYHEKRERHNIITKHLLL